MVYQIKNENALSALEQIIQTMNVFISRLAFQMETFQTEMKEDKIQGYKMAMTDLLLLLLLLEIFTCPLDKVPEHGGRHK